MGSRVRNGKTFILFYVAVAAMMTVLSGCGGDDDNPPPPITYSISGAVSGAIASGVPVNLTGANNASTTTDGSGNYNFTGLANGSYSVTPSKLGYAFTPVSTPVTVNGANITGVNFTSAGTFDNVSLNGDYLIMLTEVFDGPGAMTYSEHAGTLSFNGAGSVTVNGASRSNDGTTVTTTPSETVTVSYSVNADGSFTIYGSDWKTLHGQIVLDGSSLLLDGTMQGTSVNDYLDNGVAMKRVTAGTPPTYNNASLNGDYLIMLTEVYDDVTMTYCDRAGTLSFNGAGLVTLNGENRCSDGATVTTGPKTETVSYSVNGDGSFTIDGSGPKPLHGQIALDGSSLLLDGTMQGASVNDYLDNGVAMRR